MSDDVDPKLRGLGRGLNALFEDEEGVYPQPDPEGHTPAGRFRDVVGIERLQPSLLQPRTHFDEEALDQLADSIKSHGLLQPIVVRKDKLQDDHFEIIAGERRWRASQKAQLHEVPIVVLDLTDTEALEIALIENLQREDLNPVEEAYGYQKLLDYGHTQDAIGEALGKSRPYIANMIRLLKLPSKVLKMLEKNEISIGHARALIGVENAETLAKEIVAKGLNVRQTEALAAQQAGREPARSPSKSSGGSSAQEKDVDTIALEEEISRRIGMKLSIDSKDGQKGTVRVSYNSLDQLDEILKRLTQTDVNEAQSDGPEIIHTRLMS